MSLWVRGRQPCACACGRSWVRCVCRGGGRGLGLDGAHEGWLIRARGAVAGMVKTEMGGAVGG